MRQRQPTTQAKVGHRPWVWWCLALFVLLVQQGAWLHALSHVGELRLAGGGDRLAHAGQVIAKEALIRAPDEEHNHASAEQALDRCLVCLAYAATAHGVVAGVPALVLVDVTHACEGVWGRTPRVAQFEALYRSRAPPLG